jgi:hypothetical protein
MILLVVVTTTVPLRAGVITAVDPGTVVTDKLINFEGILGFGVPIINVDIILDRVGASFAERFQGQTLGSATITVGVNTSVLDTLSGSPSSPLTLVPGLSMQNLSVADDGFSNTVLGGNGQKGFIGEGIGEGAVSILFDSDVNDFVIDGIGFDGGNITFLFFGRDGSDLGTFNSGSIGSIGSMTTMTFAFRSSGTPIAGVSMLNLDDDGIGFDNLGFSFQTTPVPEPSSCCLALLGAGFAASFFRKRRRSSKPVE